jgi:hypothetical protein
MYYLNNQANTKHQRREFCTRAYGAFTLGKDPLSQYTEVDVIQAAKF